MVVLSDFFHNLLFLCTGADCVVNMLPHKLLCRHCLNIFVQLHLHCNFSAQADPDICCNLIHIFLLSTIYFYFFSHTTQHNIQNTTKQNHRHILKISRSNQKGGGEGRTTRTQKLLLYIITYIQQKTLPSINGRRPGPTNSRRYTFT